MKLMKLSSIAQVKIVGCTIIFLTDTLNLEFQEMVLTFTSVLPEKMLGYITAPKVMRRSLISQ
jgi:hypothetical protein